MEQKKNRKLQEKVQEAKTSAPPPSPPAKTAASQTADSSEPSGNEEVEAEIARLHSEITKLEGQRDKALFELDNMKEELDAAQEQISKKRPMEKPTSLPKPKKRESRPHSESEALDELQAELDMEKVAHQLVREDLEQVQSSREHLSEELSKTKRELEKMKKLAAVQISADTSKDQSQTGSRFKTMAMGMKSPVADGADTDKVQKALEKSQSEKEKLETELERTKKELQLLKVRSESSAK